jgi:hypothetical protein
MKMIIDWATARQILLKYYPSFVSKWALADSTFKIA